MRQDSHLQCVLNSCVSALGDVPIEMHSQRSLAQFIWHSSVLFYFYPLTKSIVNLEKRIIHYFNHNVFAMSCVIRYQG